MSAAASSFVTYHISVPAGKDLRTSHTAAYHEIEKVAMPSETLTCMSNALFQMRTSDAEKSSIQRTVHLSCD